MLPGSHSSARSSPSLLEARDRPERLFSIIGAQLHAHVTAFGDLRLGQPSALRRARTDPASFSLDMMSLILPDDRQNPSPGHLPVLSRVLTCAAFAGKSVLGS